MRVPRARLHVFVPLDTFSGEERERWRQYVSDRGGLNRAERDAFEDAYVQRVLADKIPADEPHALVRRQGRQTLICPLGMHERAAHAFHAFRQGVPDVVAEASVAERTVDIVLEPLLLGRRRPYVLEEPWAVPLHWYLLFAPAEHRVRDHPEGRGTRTLYVTQVGQARKRLEDAADAVEPVANAIDGLVDGIGALALWLDAFPTQSMLELDGDALRGLDRSAAVDRENTCAMMWDIVDGFGSADDDTLAATFVQLRSRWGRRWALQHLN